MVPARFFCPDLTAAEAVLEGHELHHMRTVRRLAIGAEVELFDGCGRLARCRLARLDRHRAQLEVLSMIQSEAPQRQLTIATAAPKRGRRFALHRQLIVGIGPDRCLVFRRGLFRRGRGCLVLVGRKNN